VLHLTCALCTAILWDEKGILARESAELSYGTALQPAAMSNHLQLIQHTRCCKIGCLITTELSSLLCSCSDELTTEVRTIVFTIVGLSHSAYADCDEQLSALYTCYNGLPLIRGQLLYADTSFIVGFISDLIIHD